MHPLPRQTRRVSVVLFADDVAQLERRYGRGWSEQIRLLIERNCKEYTKHKRTLEEIMREHRGQ